MKVKDLIEMDICIDVWDDVCEELGIAFCGPMKLTTAGKRHFREVLTYDVVLRPDHLLGPIAVVKIDDPDDAVWQKRLRKAIEFFHGAAGFVDEESYYKWFSFEE